MAGGSSTDYIKHHLTNLVYGEKADGTWGFATTAEEIGEMGFWAIHVDSLGWSFAMGALFLLIFTRAAKRATAGVPSGLQNVVEVVVEFVDVINFYNLSAAFINSIGGVELLFVSNMGSQVHWFRNIAQKIALVLLLY